MNLFLSLLSSALLLLVISIAKCDEDLQHQIDVLKDALAIEKQERILHIANNKKEINYLSEQVGQITGKLMDLSTGLSDLSEDIGHLSGKLNELVTEVGDNTRDLNELSEKVGNSSGKLNYLSGEVRNNLVKLNSLSTEVGSNSGKLENLSTKVGYNSRQLNDVSGKVGGISGLVNEISKEVGYNSEKINDLTTNVGTNSISLNLLSGNVGNNSHQLYDLYAELSDISKEVGHNSKKGSIYFTARRIHDLDTHTTRAWTTLTYDSILASSPDRSLNLINGFFTAPTDGTYFFHAHAAVYPGGYIDIVIRQNGQFMSHSYNGDDQFKSSASTSAILKLSRNDVVDVWIYGHLSGATDGRTQFSGYLL